MPTITEILDRNQMLSAQNGRMRAALADARAQFQEYADHHNAKTPPDTEKANRNLAWVGRITELLEG